MGRNARLRKLRREARRLGAPDPATAKFAKTYQNSHPDQILVSSGGAEKMSQVIEEFAEPLLHDADSLDEIKKALLFAMTAWNYALLEGVSQEQPDELYSKIMQDPEARPVFEFFLERKRQLYPNNRRAIIDFELTPNETGVQFNVVSTM